MVSPTNTFLNDPLLWFNRKTVVSPWLSALRLSTPPSPLSCNAPVLINNLKENENLSYLLNRFGSECAVMWWRTGNEPGRFKNAAVWKSATHTSPSWHEVFCHSPAFQSVGANTHIYRDTLSVRGPGLSTSHVSPLPVLASVCEWWREWKVFSFVLGFFSPFCVWPLPPAAC